MKKGFTLIELVAVVAIIVILYSIVLASLNSARKKAKEAEQEIVLSRVEDRFKKVEIEDVSYNEEAPCVQILDLEARRECEEGVYNNSNRMIQECIKRYAND